jgi:gliding motility-associated-like protein
LTIFNRWGNIVFETDNYTNDWQGTTNVNLTLGGELLPTGTYFYILDLKQEDMEIFKGYVYIQR